MNAAYSRALGNHIRTIRQRKGWTQEQLAAKLQLIDCDMTRSALAKIEVGQRHLYPDELKALRIVFDIDYEQIFV
ncbi:MAG: helix-turn-helix transcriptional regulator [Evtepia sp.]